MFKIFVIVFLASGGGPVAHSKSVAFPSLEACTAELKSEDASDPKALAAFKQYAEAVIGQEVRLAATCAEVGEDGEALDKSQLPAGDE